MIAVTSEREAAVMGLLIRAAEEGAPCPSNEQIAQRIGLRSHATASDLILELHRRGKIEVFRTGNSRVVRIGEKCTGPSRTGWHVYVEKKQRNPTFVDRDPCFMCGTRADVGCRHRRAA